VVSGLELKKFMFNPEIRKNSNKLTMSLESTFNGIYLAVISRIFEMLEEVQGKLSGSTLVDSKTSGIGRSSGDVVHFDCLKHKDTLVTVMKEYALWDPNFAD